MKNNYHVSIEFVFGNKKLYSFSKTLRCMHFELKKDGEFEYLDEGNGPIMIVLHGLFGALSNFQHVVNHFSKFYRVIIPLMPVYSLPIIDTNLKNLAKYIERFINEKGFDKVILLGNSMGGHVGLIYTTMCPEKVDALILTGSSGLYENAFGSTYPRKNDYEFIKSRVEYTFYDPKVATKELVDEVFALVNDKAKAIRSISLAKSAIRHNMRHELPNIKVPVCLIWGKNDNITPPEVAIEFHEKLPDSDLYWMDQCGHAPMMEKPEEFNRILTEWLILRKKLVIA